jgi:hypothetical protein
VRYYSIDDKVRMLLTWAETTDWMDKIKSKQELPDVLVPLASLFDRNKVRFARRVIEYTENKETSAPLTRVQLFEEVRACTPL